MTPSSLGDSQRRLWSRMAVWIVAIVLLTKIVFMGLIDLIPEEAYYWNYAQHLDIGYLDHPPMVAWLNWLSTSLFGNTEFAVRLPAILSWIVLAVFVFRLAREMHSWDAAFGSIILLAVLPIYWSVGFIMTPDAPLYPAWAAALFYSRRALVDSDRRAWLGVGVSMGLGLLSKYTIAVLGAAMLVLVLSDRTARQSLATVGPYAAALLAVVLFSPVLFWNAEHNWMSFAFQGSRRWSFGLNFNLHILIGSALILLTPVGFTEAIRAIARSLKSLRQRLTVPGPSLDNLRFSLYSCLVPLSVFVVHSIWNQTKLNWTGPVWLAVLPLLAGRMFASRTGQGGRLSLPIRRVWLVTIGFLLLFYPLTLAWLSVGGPGIPVKSWSALPVAWAEMGREIDNIESAIERKTGKEPLFVGIDKYWIASEASFYNEKDRDSLPEFAGCGMFNRNGLMWSHWVPPSTAIDRYVIIVGLTAEALNHPAILRHFSALDPVVEQSLKRWNRTVGRFYWRRGVGYQPSAGGSPVPRPFAAAIPATQ